eukprot:11132946-Alexandrium_andersonii.AAC.1
MCIRDRAFKVPNGHLNVLPTGAAMPGGLPGGQGGLDEWPDRADGDCLDQPTQGGRERERPLTFRPGVVALL